MCIRDRVGRGEAELLGGTWAHITHPDDIARSQGMVDRVLAAEPPSAGVIGTNLAAGDRHLAAALRSGRPVVSDALPTAATGASGAPVVAVAVPFPSGSGPRVLSGSVALQDHELGEYVDHAVSLPSAKVYLVDAAGTVLAGSRSAGRPATIDPGLATVATSAVSPPGRRCASARPATARSSTTRWSGCW